MSEPWSTGRFRSCGHPRTPDNTASGGRCRCCRRTYSRDYKRRVLGQKARPDKKKAEPLLTGSDALLRALWRSHWPILRALAAQGRTVVRP